MGTEFVGTTPWKRISAALATTGPRAAAIAYLGIDGPRLLRGLRRGDLLVVNATKEAVASHATSPAAIASLTWSPPHHDRAAPLVTVEVSRATSEQPGGPADRATGCR